VSCAQGLKALFLEGNAIDSLDGLQTLTALRCLYMQQNCVTEIEEGTLDNLTDLKQINLRCGPFPCATVAAAEGRHCP
jgi:dynein assembly factor 1